jgi:hypothetical protein
VEFGFHFEELGKAIFIKKIVKFKIIYLRFITQWAVAYVKVLNKKICIIFCLVSVKVIVKDYIITLLSLSRYKNKIFCP